MRRSRSDRQGQGQLTWGNRRLRRLGVLLAVGALLCAGLLTSGALGMVSEGGSGTDSTPTATDTTATAPTDTASTATDTAPTSTAAETTPASTTTETTTTSTTPSTSPSPFAPSISSDLADYPPGATVTLTGAGWGPGEAVHIYVNDNAAQTWDYNGDVTADATGGFSKQFQLPNWFVATYSVAATGSSGATATTSFTDAISTTTTLVSSANPSAVKQSVTFTATVTCSSTCTFGSQTVAFVENANSNCGGGTTLGSTSTLTGSGLSRQATFTISTLSVATHSIRACFNGGGPGTTPGASTSDPPVSQVVNSGPSAKLVFTSQPTNTAVNNSINGATGGVNVAVQDADGNTNPASSAAITIAIGNNAGGGALSGTTTANAVNGVATFSNLSINAAGTGYTLAASSAGLTGATSSSFDVTKANTTAIVSCTPTSLVIDASTTCTATVTDSSTAKTVPTGSVSWSTNTAPASQFNATSCTLAPTGNAGQSSCQTTYTPSSAATHTITATYGGDGNHNGSSDPQSLTVSKRVTTTSISCSPSPVTVGQPTTCTATVTDTSSGSTSKPTGTVSNWSSDRTGTFTATSCSLSGTGSSATCSVAFTPSQGNTHKISASYGGDGEHNTSAGNFSLSTNTLPTTTLTVDPASGTFGGTVTVTATLKNASTSAGISGKAISFALNGTTVCGVTGKPACPTTNASGVATLSGVSLSGIAVGTYPGGVVATFAGDGSFNASTGSNTLTVNAAGPTKLAYTTPARTGAVDDCLGPITVQTQNASDSPTNVTSTTTVNLASDGSGGFFTDSSCGTSTGASVTISSGSNSATFYYKPAARGSGSHQLTASASGLSSAAQTQTVNKADQTITFAQPASPAPYNTSFAINPTASSGLPAAVGVTGPCTYNGALGTVTMTAGSGTCAITASQSGDANYNAAPTVTRNVVATTASQTITFPALADKTVGDADFDPGATASSGLAVSYSTGATDQCTIVSNKVHMTSAGSCAVTASQAGDGNYSAATPVSRTFSINKAQATLAFAAGTLSRSYDSTPNAVAVNTPPSDLSGVSVTYDGSSAAPTNAGSYAVLASLSNANYQATPISGTLVIGKASQSITFDALAGKTFGDADFTVSATASSGLPVSFNANGDCNVSGNSVHIIGAGSCTITASQAGNGNYNAAADVAQSFAIDKASQTITFGALADQTYGNADFMVSATASSGLGVAFSAVGNCNVTLGGFVHITGAGSCTVTASQAGNANYNAAADVSRGFDIAKADQTISFANLADKTFGDAAFDVSASASSGLSVGFETSGNCSISGHTVTITGAGHCNVTASQAGNANYNAAADVSRGFDIAKAHATLSLSNLHPTYSGSPKAATVSTDPAGLGGTHLTYDGSATAPTNAGSYAVVASLDNPNYEASNAGGTLVIDKAHATLSLSTLHHTYSGSPKAATVSTDPAGLGGTDLTYDGSATAPTNAGSYAVVASLNNANYEAEDATGTLVIDKADQSINFAPLADKTYGGAPFTVTAVGGGSGNPVTFAVGASDQCTISGSTVHMTGAGSCTVTASQAGNGNNQAAAPVSRTFAIGKAALSVDPASYTITYGAPRPTIDVVYNSFVSGDTASSLDGTLSCGYTPAATATPDAGTYVISCSGQTSANYTITYHTGTLTVKKADQAITFPPIADKPLGAADFDAGATVNSPLAVSLAAGPAAVCSIADDGKIHTAAVSACTVTASQAGNANYNPAPSVSRTFNVNYVWHGFFQPVDNNPDPTGASITVLNMAKAGSAIPVKFDLSGNQGLSIMFDSTSPSVKQFTCPSGAVVADTIEEILAATNSGLQYDATANAPYGQYIYVWKTSSSWTNTCQKLTVKLRDGTSHYAFFKFAK